MAHTFTQLYYHIVFSTKNRHPWITDDLAVRLHPYLGGAIRDQGGAALCVNGMPDHIHILARLRQDKALSDMMRDLKANSSGWVHREMPGLRDFAWQGGYAAFTVSTSQKERVSQYIAKQREHHRVLSYRDELLALLKAHEMEFDENYFLD